MMLLGILVVGALWGVTTPLMRIEGQEENQQQKQNPNKRLPLLLQLFLRWRFLVLYLLNQLGSVVFYSLLGSYGE
ncbi:hypothetical protein, conserved [Eimeria acervulina]|uniref:Uncharacterized protein n=1 Tax=Eimeria acervulina TaxID=5801 RepID=U6GP43_EIMAC|nr:hypothetical protein, conserved [Eimeria acervulina]CDI81991.1 hypothetical protein, conserved [Eimeria acervulina]